jgi:hypothetical protein
VAGSRYAFRNPGKARCRIYWCRRKTFEHSQFALVITSLFDSRARYEMGAVIAVTVVEDDLGRNNSTPCLSWGSAIRSTTRQLSSLIEFQRCGGPARRKEWLKGRIFERISYI